MKQCKFCGKKAAYSVNIELSPDGKVTCLTSSILYVCNKHKETVTRENVIDEAGWLKICEGFILQRLALPRKEFSDVVLVPLEEQPI